MAAAQAIRRVDLAPAPAPWRVPDPEPHDGGRPDRCGRASTSRWGIGAGRWCLDWKTGRETPQAAEDARAQLAVYALWACRRFRVPPERVRVQAVWLQGDGRWRPERVKRGELAAAARRVREEAAVEAALVSAQANVEGQVPPLPRADRGLSAATELSGVLAVPLQGALPRGAGGLRARLSGHMVLFRHPPRRRGKAPALGEPWLGHRFL